ncbi:MAG: hypothetical protein HY347_09605 [candidate division NC10 bacterium]|nr:hypothetical protein [candidate division NC10 bacterium]
MIRRLFWIVVLGALVYVGVKVGYAYYQYFQMVVVVDEVADGAVAQLSRQRRGFTREIQEGMVDNLLKRAAEVNLTLEPRNIAIEVEQTAFTLTARWTTDLPLIGYTHRFRFEVEKRQPLPTAR